MERFKKLIYSIITVTIALFLVIFYGGWSPYSGPLVYTAKNNESKVASEPIKITDDKIYKIISVVETGSDKYTDSNGFYIYYDVKNITNKTIRILYLEVVWKDSTGTIIGQTFLTDLNFGINLKPKESIRLTGIYPDGINPFLLGQNVEIRTLSIFND